MDVITFYNAIGGLVSNTDADRQAIESAIESRMREVPVDNREAARLNGEIVELKFYLNSKLPIARLPLEVLSEIFYIYAIRPPGLSWVLRSRLVGHRWWFTLLHVCRLWRSTALSLPKLWTTITPTHPHVVQMSLSLSRRLPLSIEHHFSPRHHSSSTGSPNEEEDVLTMQNIVDSYKLVLSEFPRVRSAYLQVTERIMSEVFSITNPEILEAPLLKTMEVSLGNGVLSLPVFGSMKLPRLTHLSISNANHGVLLCLVRPTLTSLTLKEYSSPSSGFVDVLFGLPALQTLDLHYTGKDPQVHGELPGELPQPSRRVFLRHLEEVHISSSTGSSVASADLLNHIIIPDNAKLRLYFAVPDSALILPAIFAKAQTISGDMKRPRSIYLYCCDFHEVFISFWMDKQSLPGQHWYTHDDNCSLTIGLYPEQDNVEETVTELLMGFDLSEIVTMKFSFLELPPDAWFDGFQGMTKLEGLELEHASFDKYFIEGLTLTEPAEPGSTDTTTPVFIFPSLKVLILRLADMKVDPYSEDSDEDLLDPLIEMLVMRRALGSSLNRLVFEDVANLTDEHLALLTQHVAGEVVRESGEDSNDCDCSECRESRQSKLADLQDSSAETGQDAAEV